MDELEAIDRVSKSLRVLLSSQGMSFRDVQDAATGELSVAAFWANVVQYGRQT
jgi:hypothetical protein